MRYLPIIAGAILIAAGPARADEIEDDHRPAHYAQQVPEISLTDIEPTPEMWMYLQERRRFEDPQAAVRRKAEFRAQQRQQRIAAMKAFGFSKQRPLANHTPFYTYFSPLTSYGWLTLSPGVVIELPLNYGD